MFGVLLKAASRWQQQPVVVAADLLQVKVADPVCFRKIPASSRLHSPDHIMTDGHNILQNQSPTGSENSHQESLPLCPSSPPQTQIVTSQKHSWNAFLEELS
ncbi:hypothetical protein AMECASPLE_013234 [Ameca splendens]|uniref:Uncharacterized protein n=1 Tax=Ameca splendens TaxID=208324 RepID=A0ABV0ZMD2_9TELE